MKVFERLDSFRISKKSAGRVREAEIIARCMEIVREELGPNTMKPAPVAVIKTEWREVAGYPASHWEGLIK